MSEEIFVEQSKQIRLINHFPEGVEHLLAEIEANDDLWNTHTARTSSPTSPHREVSDIILRMSKEIQEGSPVDLTKPHEFSWWEAGERLELVRDVCLNMAKILNMDIGTVLITRIPPGKQVLLHTDEGYNAENSNKIAIQLKGHKGQFWVFPDGVFETVTGDIYEFNNRMIHGVVNASEYERMTLIMCFLPRTI